MGKTTLLTRVAAGDIAGFPAALRVVYVQHEVLAQSDEAVAEFMRAAGAVAGAAAACGASEVDAALDAVGFTPALKAARVGQLSGGWRMRLAIARSMLHHVRLARLLRPRWLSWAHARVPAHRLRLICCCWTSRRTPWTRARWRGCAATCGRGCPG